MKILIVDDEADIREVLRMDLEDQGFQVIEADSGNQALSVCMDKSNGVDLIISDMNMPNGNGTTLLKGLRKEKIDCPVILFLSGNSDSDYEEVFGLGAGAVLSKPWSVPELIANIRSLTQKLERR